MRWREEETGSAMVDVDLATWSLVVGVGLRIVLVDVELETVTGGGAEERVGCLARRIDASLDYWGIFSCAL